MLTTRLPADAVTPDPIASPTQVPASHVFELPRSIPNTNAAVQRLFLAGDGGAPTVILYVLEQTRPEQLGIGEVINSAESRWYEVTGALALTNRILLPAVDAASNPLQLPPGLVYARITVAGVANTRAVIAFA